MKKTFTLQLFLIACCIVPLSITAQNSSHQFNMTHSGGTLATYGLQAVAA